MNLIDKYFKQNKNIKIVGILLGVSVGIFLLTFILWELLFSRYYIFSKQEDSFKEAVEKYYEYRKEFLPKKGEIREITLEKLFLEERISELTVPKSKEVCDTDSWVRVYHNENGEYEYYTYLKCGHYESNIDHEGPQITLNGDSETIINYGQAYKELGIKSVVDNTDGEMDITKVEIDSSKVDINKVGSYKVTYKIRDSFNNQTKVTRTVIVAKNLTEIVKEQTDESNYYKGKTPNNYVQFSGMLWRIINVNSDGTVKLITEQLASNLRYTEDTYKDSNVDTWLNNVFLPAITSDKYLVETEYCVGNITSLQDTTNSCSEKIKSKVGLLSIDEFNKTINGNWSSTNYENYYYYLLGNKVNNQIVIAESYGTVRNLDNTELPPIKPVITIKANMYISSGDGTETSPYKLSDYSYAKEHDKINTRIVGEYFNYSDTIFRITGIDKNNNVKAVMAEPLINHTTDQPVLLSIEGLQNYKFDINDENNPGYALNNNYIDYVNENNIISANYKVFVNDSSKKYNQFENTKVKAKLMLISTTDLFSGINTLNNNGKGVQLFADHTTRNDTVIMMNTLNGMVLELYSEVYTYYSARALANINGNLKIKSGKGTVYEPYILK